MVEKLPLPHNWEEAITDDGRKFYIDHNTRRTSWIDPRDKIIKPHSFSDCLSNELPIGWEELNDELFGIYFIDHINQKNQREDPRKTLLRRQKKMLSEFVELARFEINKKEKIVAVKSNEIEVAKQEMRNFRTLVTSSDDAKQMNVASSKDSSVNSSSTSISTLSDRKITSNFNPDVARAELSRIRDRIRVLKEEKELASVDLEVARTKHFAICSQWTEISTTDSASQTSTSSNDDVTSSEMNGGGSLVGIAEVEEQKGVILSQLQHTNEKIHLLTEQLRSLARKNSDVANPNTLLLISQKEQQLNELYCKNASANTSEDEKRSARICVKKLERELKSAKNKNNEEMFDRLKHAERHESIRRELSDKFELLCKLQNRLRSLSVSSSSLSSTSSQGSSPSSAFNRRNNSMTRSQAQVIRKNLRQKDSTASRPSRRPLTVHPSSLGSSKSSLLSRGSSAISLSVIDEMTSEDVTSADSLHGRNARSSNDVSCRNHHECDVTTHTTLERAASVGRDSPAPTPIPLQRRKLPAYVDSFNYKRS